MLALQSWLLMKDTSLDALGHIISDILEIL